VRLERGLRLFEREAKFCIYTVEFLGDIYNWNDRSSYYSIAAMMKMAIDEVQWSLKRRDKRSQPSKKEKKLVLKSNAFIGSISYTLSHHNCTNRGNNPYQDPERHWHLCTCNMLNAEIKPCQIQICTPWVNRTFLNKIYNLAFPPLRTTVHWMRPLGLDWGAYTSASLPVFLRPLCQLKSISK